MGIGLGGIKVPGAYQAGPSQSQPPQLPPEYLAQLAEQNRVKKLVNAYKASPEAYSEGEALQLQQQAIQAGIPMEIKSSEGARWGKGLLAMVDRATFGLLVPDDLYAPVNAAERKAVGWGQMAGNFVPWGGPFRLAGAGAKGLRALMGTAKGAKNPIVKEIMTGFKNPMGVGKILPGFGKEGAKTAAKKTTETVAKIPRVGKNFSASMNSIIKSKKGFWSGVDKLKTQAEKRKFAKKWIMQNMHKGDRGSKNMHARVEGWLNKKFPDPVKPLQLGPGATRIGPGTRAGTRNEKGTFHMGGGKGPGKTIKVFGPDGTIWQIPVKPGQTQKQAIQEALKKHGGSKKPKFKDAKFEEVGTGASKNVNQTIKGKQTMESIKKKLSKKNLSSKVTHKKGKRGRKVTGTARLTANERTFIRGKLTAKQLRRLSKHKKGISRDREMLRMAKQSGIV